MSKKNKKGEEIYGIDIRYLEVLILYITFICFSIAYWKGIFGEFSFQLIFISLGFSTLSLISAFISLSVVRFREKEFFGLGFEFRKFEEYFCRVSTLCLFVSVGFLFLSLLISETSCVAKLIVFYILIIVLAGVKLYETLFVD